MKLRGTQTCLRSLGEKVILGPAGNRTMISPRPAHNLITTLAALFRLPICQEALHFLWNMKSHCPISQQPFSALFSEAHHVNLG